MAKTKIFQVVWLLQALITICLICTLWAVAADEGKELKGAPANIRGAEIFQPVWYAFVYLAALAVSALVLLSSMFKGAVMYGINVGMHVVLCQVALVLAVEVSPDKNAPEQALVAFASMYIIITTLMVLMLMMWRDDIGGDGEDGGKQQRATATSQYKEEVATPPAAEGTPR